METREEGAAVSTPPPGWILQTPTRRREVWMLPALSFALAVLLVVAGVLFGGRLALVVGVAAGAVVAAGATTLLVTGRWAYEEQTLAASWRFHVARVVTGVTTAVVVALASLAVGASIGVATGALGGVLQMFRFAREVPRLDRLVVAWASVVVASTCLVLVVLGLTVAEVLGQRASVWVGAGGVLVVLSVVVALVQFRRAARAPRD